MAIWKAVKELMMESSERIIFAVGGGRGRLVTFGISIRQ